MTVSIYLFFFHDTALTEIYTLSLHDALPIYRRRTNTNGFPDLPDEPPRVVPPFAGSEHGLTHERVHFRRREVGLDRKSTRLNSSHSQISYAVFCLKKKKI